MAADDSKPRETLSDLGSNAITRRDLILLCLAGVTALVVIAILVAVFGTVPSSGRYITGSGFVFLLGIVLVGVGSLVWAWRDGRTRRARGDSSGAPSGGPSGSSALRPPD
jgi:hypothetical protein